MPHLLLEQSALGPLQIIINTVIIGPLRYIIHGTTATEYM